LDPFSDVLSLLHVEGGISAGLEAGGAWAVDFSGYRFVKFGTVLHGSCWLTVQGSDSPVQLGIGDCYVLTNGKPFRLGGDLHTKTVPASEVYAHISGGMARCGTGADTRLAGGRFTFDEASAPVLLELLPPIIHMHAATDQAAMLRWVVERLTHELEASRAGAQLMTRHLVQLLRDFAASHDSPPVGWLRALSDSKIGAALKLMHGDVARRWTVERLAEAVGLSRSTFAARFREIVGVPPLDYLLQWRMRLARNALTDNGKTVSSVALSLGYNPRVPSAIHSSAWSVSRPASIASSPSDVLQCRAAARRNYDLFHSAVHIQAR
jgi:AraC-like DNA-binding protein